MDFQTYIRAVGTGPKLNRELTKEEVYDAITQILEKKVLSERICAFLLGWRVRLESNEELKATLEVFDKYIIKKNIPNSIELAYPYDGKAKTPYLFPLYAKYLKQFDLSLIISGDYLQPAKKGITTKDICTNIILDENIKYFDRKDYFIELSNLTKIRNILGLRTIFNTCEKLLNPANSDFAIVSAFHKPYVEKYNTIFANRYKQLSIVKGSEGTAEVFAKCRYWINKNNVLEEYTIDPQYFGIKYESVDNKISLEQSLDFINNPSPTLEKLAKLNVALLLHSANKVKSINEAYEMLN